MSRLEAAHVWTNNQQRPRHNPQPVEIATSQTSVLNLENQQQYSDPGWKLGSCPMARKDQRQQPTETYCLCTWNPTIHIALFLLFAGFPSKTSTRFGMIWNDLGMDTVCPRMPTNPTLQDCPWSISASNFVPGLLGEGLRPVDPTGHHRPPKPMWLCLYQYPSRQLMFVVVSWHRATPSSHPFRSRFSMT